MCCLGIEFLTLKCIEGTLYCIVETVNPSVSCSPHSRSGQCVLDIVLSLDQLSLTADPCEEAVCRLQSKDASTGEPRHIG